MNSHPPSDPWADHLGIVEVPDDAATKLALDLTDDHLNFLDGAHGGVLFSLAEAALRAAAGRDGATATVLDAHLSLTAGATKGDRFTAVAEPVKEGRTLSVFRVRVTRSDGRLVGDFAGTVRHT